MHLLQTASNAGQVLRLWFAELPRRPHVTFLLLFQDGGVCLPAVSGCIDDFSLSFRPRNLRWNPVFLSTLARMASMFPSTSLSLSPLLMKTYCLLIASVGRACCVAFSSVSSGSLCNFSDSLKFCRPTTTLSCINSS